MNSHGNLGTCPSQFQLDLYFLKGAEASDPLAEHVAACPGCAAAVEAMRRALPGAELRARSLSAVNPSLGQRLLELFTLPRALTLAGAALAVMLVLTLGPGPVQELSKPQVPGLTGLKAGRSLTLQLLVHGRILTPGETVPVGVGLELRVTSQSAGYLNLFSLDQQGELSILARDQQIDFTFHSSATLTGPGGSEQVVALVSPAALAAGELERMAKELARGEVPADGLAYASVTIMKAGTDGP